MLRALLIGAVVAGATPLSVRAQQPGELSGRVTYSMGGQPIPGALVFVQGVSLGVITDAEGRYRIEGVPAGAHVVNTSVMGCLVSAHSVVVEAGRRLALNLALEPPVIDLEGLVVTALSSDPSSPVAVERLEVDADAAVARSVGSLLQGKAAGVRVMQGSGQPGTDPSILLRSPTSVLIPQGPLIVVDGVITPGRLTDIDPFDVDHIDVLKGAAAAAGYGSRGQGGVIEITTKRGIGRAAPQPRSGPLLFVDGVASDRSFNDLPFADIVDVRKLEGPVAAILYGRRAEVGVIEVTTRYGPPHGARTISPICLNGPP
jgi:TonB-dependent SusC/RagA subfamily outer membrane receptor